MIFYHIVAFFSGFILDLIIGDPYWLPHPIRAIGILISFFDKRFLDTVQACSSVVQGGDSKDGLCSLTYKQKRARGLLTVIMVLFITFLVSMLVMVGAYYINPLAGCIVETIMTYQILATKCLKVESMKVYDRLTKGTLEEARYAVSMIVGRDTENLNASQVAKAAVETVAENASDGVIAPMIYTALGGPVLGFLYKAINTCDSMIGYKNDRYMDFGRAAAKLDDFVNFLPSRISAWLMILSCLFLGKEFDASNALKIFKRDRYNHASPNSAQTESVCAGALGLQLAGDTSYFGKIVKKPFIGEPLREIEAKDIIRANRLMYGTAFLCQLLCILVMLVIYLCKAV